MHYPSRSVSLLVLAATCALLIGIAHAGLAERDCAAAVTPTTHPGEIVIYGDDKDKPKTNDQWNPEKLDIAVDNGYFFTILTPAIGYTIPQRETIVYKRITEILSTNPLAPVTVGKVRGRPTVWVGDIRLVTIYPVDAKVAGVSEGDLAEQIAAHTRAALKKVAPTRFALGPSTYDVAVGGTLLFRLADKDGFRWVPERGQQIERRVVELLTKGKLPTLTTQARGQDTSILANGELLLTVTQGDLAAVGNGTTLDLANAWIKNLETVWPRLTTKP
jgi:hypothetical protein